MNGARSPHTAATYPPEGGRFHVGGISNGGLSSFRVAVESPERFASLVVLPGFAPIVLVGVPVREREYGDRHVARPFRTEFRKAESAMASRLRIVREVRELRHPALEILQPGSIGQEIRHHLAADAVADTGRPAVAYP